MSLKSSPLLPCALRLEKDNQQFKQVITTDLKYLCNCFDESGYQVIRLVGGVVRDLLEHKVARDVDLSTTATPDQMKQLFLDNKIKCIETGLKHGTLTVLINKIPYEVTTLRTDVETDGRHAEIEFVTDWKLDAERRDLTINALSMDVDGHVYDYFNGIDDLKNKIVRFVGDTKTRVQEDYLRILRYFRFLDRFSDLIKQETIDLIIANMSSLSSTSDCVESSSFDYKRLLIISETVSVLKKEASGLQRISSERIWSELSLLLIGHHTPQVIRLMHFSNILFNCKLEFVYNFDYQTEFERCWNNCKTVEKQANEQPVFLSPNEKVILLPATVLASFIKESAEAATAVIEKLTVDLRLSGFEKSTLNFVTKYRKLPKNAKTDLDKYDKNECSKNEENPVISFDPEYPCLSKYQKLYAYIYAKSEQANQRKLITQLIFYESDYETLKKFVDWELPAFPINGNDILKIGYRGKAIQAEIQRLKSNWINSNFTLTKDQLTSDAAAKYNHQIN